MITTSLIRHETINTSTNLNANNQGFGIFTNPNNLVEPVITTEAYVEDNASIRSFLSYAETEDQFRSEVRWYWDHVSDINNDSSRLTMRQNYVLEFSMYPIDFDPDTDDTIFAQLLQTPDANGEDSKSAAVSFQELNGRVQIRIISDKSRVTSDSSTKVVTYYDCGPMTTGAWTHYRLHIRTDHTSKGFAHIWRDGQQMVRHDGPTGFNDEWGPLFKVGIYKRGWEGGSTDTTYRDALYDRFKLYRA